MTGERLPIVGQGPTFQRVRSRMDPGLQLEALAVGEEVDVLLDDGRIVRTTVRGVPSGEMAWVEGIAGGYALSRIRRRDGWKPYPGVHYCHVCNAPCPRQALECPPYGQPCPSDCPRVAAGGAA